MKNLKTKLLSVLCSTCLVTIINPVYAKTDNITLFGITRGDFVEVIFVLKNDQPAFLDLKQINGKKVDIIYALQKYQANIDTKKMIIQSGKLYFPLTNNKFTSSGFKYVSALAYVGNKQQPQNAIEYNQKPYKFDREKVKNELTDIARKEIILNKPSNSKVTDDHIKSYILPEQLEVFEPIDKDKHYCFASYSTMGNAPHASILTDENKNIIWSDISYDNENFSKYRMATAFDCMGDKFSEVILLHMHGSGESGYSILKFNSASQVKLIDTEEVMKKYLKK